MRAAAILAVLLGCGGATARDEPAWWCAEDYDITGRSGGRCERTEEACYEGRDARVRDGATMTECEARGTAFCMTHGGTAFCGTEIWCHVQRDEAIRAGASPTPCRETR